MPLNQIETQNLTSMCKNNKRDGAIFRMERFMQRRYGWKHILLGAVFFIPFPSPGQEIFPPDPVKKRISAERIENNLKIDGKLDEREWQFPYTINDFTQTDPHQGAPAKRKTVVKLAYNKHYLYVAAICYDTIGKDNYRVLNFKRDYVASNGDFFAFAIDGYNDERNAAMFGVNPYGVQRDLLAFDDNHYDPDWDGLWFVRAERTDTAWIAEAAVPWKTLRYKNNGDSLQTWGISFGRIARTSNEFSNWPAFPRAYGGLRMAYAGKLVGIQAPKPSTNIRVQPYLLYAYNETREDRRTIDSKHVLRPGGDVKWAINPNTLMDLTFNTDFAQADVDRKVNNINRFSVFYPERRQFFLENAGLFTAGVDPLPNGHADYSARIQPFFSRAIGLDASGRPLRIDAGARLVYRSDKRNVGGLAIRQDGNATTRPANFFVGRFSQNFGKQNRIGTLVSYKRETGGGSSPASRNFSGTIDGFFRFNQSLSWSFMGSSVVDSGDRTGYAGMSRLHYSSNRWSAWWTQSFVTRKYAPQTGFVARPNAIITDPGVIFQERGKWLPRFIRSYNPGISLTMYHDATTFSLTDRYLNVSPLWFQFQKGGVVSWNVTFMEQVLDGDFKPLGVVIPAGTYNYVRHKIVVSSDQSRKIAAMLTANVGQFYNGHYNALAGAASFSPDPHFFISPNVELGKLTQGGGAEAKKDIVLYAVEARLALNPRLQLSGLFQRSNVSHSVSWNARFSWEFKPLSYFYIVFNDNSITHPVDTAEQQIISKITYLKQF